jgi:hypothetical protein
MANTSSSVLSEVKKISGNMLSTIKEILNKNDISYSEVDSMNLVVNKSDEHSISSDEIRALATEAAGCSILAFDTLIDMVDVNNKVYVRQQLK